MSLITIGLNHKTAPVALRERLAFTPDTLPDAVRQLAKVDCVSEAAILSTCNRTELYCTVHDHQSTQTSNWWNGSAGFMDLRPMISTSISTSTTTTKPSATL